MRCNTERAFYSTHCCLLRSFLVHSSTYLSIPKVPYRYCCSHRSYRNSGFTFLPTSHHRPTNTDHRTGTASKCPDGVFQTQTNQTEDIHPRYFMETNPCGSFTNTKPFMFKRKASLTILHGTPPVTTRRPYPSPSNMPQTGQTPQHLN